MFKTIKPGDRVTIRTALGQERDGRAIMFNCKVQGWLLNMGGKHGSPAIATEKNVLAVKASRHDEFHAIASIINGRN